MTSYTQTPISNRSYHAKPPCLTSFAPIFSEATKHIVLVLWECKNCGRLYVSTAANPESMPTPLIIECVTGADLPVPCQYGRLDRFGSIDLTEGKVGSASKWEFWKCAIFGMGLVRVRVSCIQ